MALRFSQGLCERQAGDIKATITGTDIALVDGGGSSDTITQVAAGFVAAGFEPGDWIEVVGATDSNDDVYQPLLAVAVGTLTIPTASFTTGETAAASITIRCRYPGLSFAELARDATLDIYSGTIPTTPDATENGTKLAAFTGVRFGDSTWDSTNKYAYVDLVATASTTVLASGTATWFRLRLGGITTTGASTTAPRIDGSVGVGSGDLQVASTTFTAGNPAAISSLRVYFKQAA